MCLAIPGRIINIAGPAVMPMATVDYGRTTRQCCLAYTPDVRVGEYVLVQNGFVVAVLEESEALASLAMFAEIGLTAPTGAPAERS